MNLAPATHPVVSSLIMQKNGNHRRISWIALLVLIFSQFMRVAHACPQEVMVQPPAPMSVSSMPPDCAQMGQMSQPHKDMSSLLCLDHCKQSSQSHQTSVPDSSGAASQIFLGIVHTDTQRVPQRTSHLHRSLRFLIISPPPLRIQNQVFRI